MMEAGAIRKILIEKDEVTLIDSEGNFIGPANKLEAHKYPTKLHLAISIWLFNQKGEVLLQKRSQKKIVGQGWWANSACGNVWPTETYFDCANRRLKVELGVTGVKLKPIYKFSYKAFGNDTYGEHELDQVYISIYDGEVNPNSDEVLEIAWVNFEQLFAKVAGLTYIFPEESLILNHDDLKAKTAPVIIKLDNQEFNLAPWSIFMLKNIKLYDAYKQLIAQFA
jgi:isopentenyl-diphosphate Delta-isomerase